MCPTLTVGNFLDAYGPIFLFICSTSSTWTTDVQYSKRGNLVQNKNIDVQNLENIRRIPPLVFFTRFFSALRLFLKFLSLHQRVSPSFVSISCNTMDVKKSQRPPFYIIRHCDTVQKSIKFFFRNFFKISQRSIFFISFYNFEPYI